HAQTRFAAYLFMYGEERDQGQAYASVSILLRRNPDHLFVPKAAFITTSQLPARTSPEDFLLTIPELIIEFRSKSNSQADIDEKVNDYLNAGAVLVWVADPEARTIAVYQSKKPSVTLTATDTLTAHPVIPDFAVPVGDLLPL